MERGDYEALSHLMLDAYRGSVDDESENIDDARAAIDHYFEIIVWPHSFVIADDDQPLAMSMVVVVAGVHYIDPVATAAGYSTRRRRTGNRSTPSLRRIVPQMPPCSSKATAMASTPIEIRYTVW